MRDLGTLGGNWSEARDLNAQGQVVGSSNLTASGCLCTPYRAFVWQDGVMQALPTLNGANSHADRINERGQVLGTSDGQSVLWDNGAIIVLGFDARAMNDQGQVVGDLNTGSAVHAAIWEAGVVTDLGTLDGGDSSWARGLSNSGWVVGGSRTATGEVHAVRWGHGGITDLGTLPGDAHAFGLYVNDAGEVAGESFAMVTRPHAFAWDEGVMQAIDAEHVSGMNAPGLITVWAGIVYTWRRGALAALPTQGFDHHAGANDVNDAGWVVGWILPLNTGGAAHAALWRPLQ